MEVFGSGGRSEVLGVGALRSDDGAGYDHDHYDNAVHFDNSTWSSVFYTGYTPGVAWASRYILDVRPDEWAGHGGSRTGRLRFAEHRWPASSAP